MTGLHRRRRPSAKQALVSALIIGTFILSAVAVFPPAPVKTPGSGFSPSPFAGPTLVSSVGTTCVSKSNVTTATMGTLASGDSVFAFVEMAQGSSQHVAGVSSTVATDHWVQVGSATNSGNTRAEIWYTSFTAGGSAYKVSVAASTAVDYCVQAVSFSGADLFHAFDVVGSGTTGSNTTATDTVVTGYANEFVLAAMAIKTTTTSQTLAQQGSWVTPQHNMATSGVGGAVVDQLIATASTSKPCITISTTLQWAALAIAVNNTGAPHTAPTALAVSGASPTTEHVTYTKPVNQPIGTVSNYTVFAGSAGGTCGTTQWASWNVLGGPTPYTSAGGTSTAITVSGLAGATDYCYGVVQWNATGRGPMSSTTTGYTLPAAPSPVNCGSPGVTSVACSWTNPSAGSGGLVNDSIYAWAGGSCSGTQLIGTPSLGVVTSDTVTGLTSATQYSFATAAWSPSGTSTISTCRTVTTLAGMPTALGISSVTTSGFTVGWTNPAGTIANDTVATTTTPCTGSWTYVSLGTSGTSQAISGLTSATTYCTAVLAWSSSGTGGPAFTNGTTLPNGPTGLTVASVTATSVSLSWSLPSGTLVNVTVYRWTGAACAGTTTATSIGSGSATTNTQSGLAGATQYSFEVQAWSAGGSGVTSSCVQGTTLPGAPTSLSVASSTTSSISLTWSNPSGTIINDTIYRWTGTSCSGTSTATSIGTSGTSDTQSGLASATAYSFEVAAWSSSGTSATTSCVTGYTLPASPTALIVSSVTTTTITLGWTNPSGAVVNDTVYRWVGGSCSGTVHATSLGSAGTSNTQTGLSAATEYSFEVQAWSSGGSGVVSSCVQGWTIPTAPTGVSVGTPTTTSLTVLWTNSAGTLVNITVYYWVGASCSGTASNVNLASTSATSSVVGGLSGATEYSFEVADWSAGGSSAASSCATGTTLPVAPTGLSVTGDTTMSISLSWANPPGSLVNVSLYEWTGASCSGSATGFSLGVVTAGTAGSLTAATQYSFEVAGWSASGTGSTSSCVTGVTTPLAPTGLTVGAVTTTTLGLSWSNPSGTLTNSTVYRWTGAACSGTATATSIGSPATLDTQSGLLSATEYSFEVSAWDSGGSSVPSSCAHGTTLPLAATGLTVSSTTTTTIVLTWTNAPGTIANVSVFYGTSCAALSAHTSLGVVTTATLTALSVATTYCVEVQEWSAGGNGAPAFTNGTTLPSAPTGLTVTGRSAITISLVWVNSAGALVNNTVYWWSGATCSGTVTAVSLAGVVTSNTTSGLQPLMEYSFEVVDWSLGGTSAPSTCVHGNTTSSGLSATIVDASAVNTTTITVTWSASNGTVTNYTLQYARFYGLAIANISVGVHLVYNVTNLGIGITYYFTVWAWVATARGPVSNVAVAQTDAPSSPPTPFPWLQIYQLDTIETVGAFAISCALAVWISGRRGDRHARGGAAVALGRSTPQTLRQEGATTPRMPGGNRSPSRASQTYTRLASRQRRP